MTARLHACGDTGVLVELEDLHEVLALRAQIEAVRDERFPGLLDMVPAARTLLLVVATPGDLARVREEAGRLARDDAALRAASREKGKAAAVDITVRYDGEDLDDVAELTGLTREQVVAAHTGTPWTVGFGGFAPGFAYLVDGDGRLEVPRREEPRTSVPAGAVALAGQFSGIYPRSSPGGWQIIGHTEAALWDVDRDPPALLQPGATVRFVEAQGSR
jgi:KipI family sensor histidine kinase inhibitor